MTDDLTTVQCNGLNNNDSEPCDQHLLTTRTDAPLCWTCDNHDDDHAATIDKPSPCPTYACGFQRQLETERGFLCLVCLHHYDRIDWRYFHGPQMDDKPRHHI